MFRILKQFLFTILVMLAGIWLLHVDLGESWYNYIANIFLNDAKVKTDKIPPLVIGIGIFIMAFGIFLRSRVAWFMSLFLLFMGILSIILTNTHSNILLAYLVILIIVLLFNSNFFNQANLLASALFAFTAVVMLVMYATFGNYYLGDQFDPQINDLVTSLYYSVVTMSTVGYGDISPVTPEAKLFTVSVILFGLTVFATAITSVITPLVNSSLNIFMGVKEKNMNRENHFIVIGDTSLAESTCKELIARGEEVTLLVEEQEANLFNNIDGIDIILGKGDSNEDLNKAGILKAKAVIAMLQDDAENAFVILATKEISKSIRTIASLNHSGNINKLKLTHPDMIISPQTFGGQIAAMWLTDEKISNDMILDSLINNV